MQSPNKDSTNNSPSPSPSPKRPPTDKPETETVAPNTNTDNPTQNSGTPAAPTGGDKGRRLSKRTLKIPTQGVKPTSGSPSPAGVAALEGLVEVPVREVAGLGSGQGGSSPAAAVVVDATTGRTSRVMNVDDPRGRSKKIKLHLKRKPVEASTSPGRPICRFCLQQFPTWKTMFDHLQTQHPTTQQQVHDQTPDHQGEDKGSGDSGAEKKSGEEGSCAATGGNGFDLNQPMEEVQGSAEKNEVEGTSDDERNDGPRKKFRFDLNEFPSNEDEDEKKP